MRTLFVSLGNGAARVAAALVMTLGTSCATQAPTVPTYPALSGQSAAQKPRENDDAIRLGGRLFDNPWKELMLDFVPDDPKTEAIDGRGGPFNNGSLPDEQGKPMPNAGHGYRLKNLLGWDLHGASGISGKAYENGACVLLPDLFNNTDSRETWIARLTKGEDAIPAYGSVLSPAQVEAIVDFLLAVRNGALPQADELFSLDENVPGFYRLLKGGDASRGHALIEKTCKRCHGAAGTSFSFDGGKHTLGTYLRTQASAAWLKILVGQPGSSMGPQLDKNAPRAQLAQELRDILAAGCDRTRYPRGSASEPEVKDGDARCGAYLK